MVRERLPFTIVFLGLCATLQTTASFADTD